MDVKIEILIIAHIKDDPDKNADFLSLSYDVSDINELSEEIMKQVFAEFLEAMKLGIEEDKDIEIYLLHLKSMECGKKIIFNDGKIEPYVNPNIQKVYVKGKPMPMYKIIQGLGFKDMAARYKKEATNGKK